MPAMKTLLRLAGFGVMINVGKLRMRWEFATALIESQARFQD